MKNVKTFGALMGALAVLLMPALAFAGEGDWYFPKYATEYRVWILSLIQTHVIPSTFAGMGLYFLSILATVFWCTVPKDFRKVPAKLGGGVTPGIIVILFAPFLFALIGEVLILIFISIPKKYETASYIVLGIFIALHFLGFFWKIFAFGKHLWKIYPKIAKAFWNMILLGLKIMKGEKSTSSPSATILFAISGGILWGILINLQLWNDLIEWQGFTTMINFIIFGVMVFLIFVKKVKVHLKDKPKGSSGKSKRVKMVKCPRCGKKYPITNAKCICGEDNLLCNLNCKDENCPDSNKPILKPGTKVCPHGCEGPLYRGNTPVTAKKKPAPPKKKTAPKQPGSGGGKAPASKKPTKKAPAKSFNLGDYMNR